MFLYLCRLLHNQTISCSATSCKHATFFINIQFLDIYRNKTKVILSVAFAKCTLQFIHVFVTHIHMYNRAFSKNAIFRSPLFQYIKLVLLDVIY